MLIALNETTVLGRRKKGRMVFICSFFSKYLNGEKLTGYRKEEAKLFLSVLV